MPLVRPQIAGPISTISRRIRVRGQLAGADVKVVSLGPSTRTVATGVAASGDDRIDLDAAEQLRSDDVLYAIQEFGGESSPAPAPGDPLGLPVQPAPTAAAALTAVAYSSVLYVCGREVWLKGGVPGASATVDASGSTLGSGTFEDAEGARFGIVPMMPGGTVLAHQSIVGVGDGPSISRVPQNLPGPSGGPLDSPVIDPLPVACNTSVKIGHVCDGAEVTLRRNDGITVVDTQFMFDAPALWAPVGRPLAEGETLTVSQAVHPQCERKSLFRDFRVGHAPPTPKPVVAGPLCAGGSWVHVDGLIAGSRVEIVANGKTYQAQTGPESTSLDAIIDPLEASSPANPKTVIARQEQCGIFGPDSNPIPVDPLPATTPQHEILRPLLACSPIVRVDKAEPGAILMAFSDVFGPISAFVRADSGGRAVIAVAPQLVDGHVIEVLQWACGGAPVKAREKVEFTENLPIPAVADVFVGRRSVEIDDLLPGATVEVVVTSKSGTVNEVDLFVADDKVAHVGLQNSLSNGDRVKARQGLCDSLTGYSAEQVTRVEPIGSDWWQWDGGNSRNATWKEDYVVSGKFTNAGGTDITDFAVTIFEDAANVGTTNYPVVAPAQAVAGATAPIKKEWQWFIPGLWVVKGPLYKEFHYKAVVSAKDIGGNPYPPTSFAELRIFVNVGKLKRTAGAYAMGVAASAAAMAASIFLLAAAAVAYGVASAAGAVAMDPPEADPNYRDRVALPPLGAVPAGSTEALIRMLRLGERVMGIELAKSLIEGRRLGALAENDEAWVEIHSQDLAEATEIQRDLIAEAAALEPAAVQEVASLVPPGTDLVSERRRLHVEGLTPEMAVGMALAESLWSGFDALLRSDVELSNPDIVSAVGESVRALMDFGQNLP